MKVLYIVLVSEKNGQRDTCAAFNEYSDAEEYKQNEEKLHKDLVFTIQKCTYER